MSVHDKYELIFNRVNSRNNQLSVVFLCETAGVSRSGYYNWLGHRNDPDSYMNRKEEQDRKDFELILIAYNHRGYSKGRRGIYMCLLHMGIRMNMKKIGRLMKKFGLFCPIRKENPYRRMARALKTSNYAENILERQFQAYGPGYVLLTDITYLFYGKERKKAYLSVIKDAFTKQILSYVLSPSLEEDFVLETVKQLYINHKDDIHTDALIHSDQGCHYTCIQFIDLLKSYEIRQSMSRRGNCWDNAPQESFFGHMKDEVSDKIKAAQTLETVRLLVDDYMDYYNNERYQWDLAKLSPNEFLQYYRTGIYPLDHIAIEPEQTRQGFIDVQIRLSQRSSSPAAIL